MFYMLHPYIKRKKVRFLNYTDNYYSVCIDLFTDGYPFLMPSDSGAPEFCCRDWLEFVFFNSD